MKEKIIGTGLTGLVGSRVVELNPQYNFIDISYPKADITKIDSLKTYFKDHPDAKTVIHFAAFTDTNAAWQQRGDKSGSCYRLNVDGTQNIADLCQKYDKKLINISTDFVFDGTKKGAYTELDPPSPIDWYGATKAEAEKISENIGATTLRISYPYRATFADKVDLVAKIRQKLTNHEVVTLFSDQITTPTFIDDIAKGIAKVLENETQGIYHLVGSSSQSPYDMGQSIAAIFDFDPRLIKESSLKAYLASQPDSRPYAFNAALSNDKFFRDFHFRPTTLRGGLLKIRQQLSQLP